MVEDMPINKKLFSLGALWIFLGTLISIYFVWQGISTFPGHWTDIHAHVNHYGMLLFVVALGFGFVGFQGLSKKLVELGYVLAVILWPLGMILFEIGVGAGILLSAVADTLLLLLTLWIALGFIGICVDGFKFNVSFEKIKDFKYLTLFISYIALFVMMGFGAFLATNYTMYGMEVPQLLKVAHIHALHFSYVTIAVIAAIMMLSFPSGLEKITVLLLLVSTFFYMIVEASLIVTDAVFSLGILLEILFAVALLLAFIGVIAGFKGERKVSFPILLMFVIITLWYAIFSFYGIWLGFNLDALEALGPAFKPYKGFHLRNFEWSMLLGLIAAGLSYFEFSDKKEMWILFILLIIPLFTALGFGLLILKIPFGLTLLRIGEPILSIGLLATAIFTGKEALTS